ncbi:tail fiber domain-containing protein [Parasedimentitalea marina]|uniref:Tail fiber domain-containing protein n=1 Tax=Parasedimentitalea marina TaxID=2483033 RepID=A0A3T0N8R9_9RHOB|nr:tail fiber domain-containing protein [Parasedimentitalea marina]
MYSTNTAIQSSDADLKHSIRVLNDAEKRVAASLKTSNRIYQWIDAVEAKGEDKARLHCVFIAQDIQAGLFQRFGHP